MSKSAPPNELLAAIQKVVEGGRYISVEIAEKMVDNYANEDKRSPFALLSDRELQITLMIIDSCKSKEIATKLNVSPKTVSTYRQRIFEKLKVDGDVDLARLAMRHGIFDARET